MVVAVQLTVYLCSTCSRVHGTHAECTLHEREGHEGVITIDGRAMTLGLDDSDSGDVEILPPDRKRKKRNDCDASTKISGTRPTLTTLPTLPPPESTPPADAAPTHSLDDLSLDNHMGKFCGYCGLYSNDRHARVIHERRHTGEKPIKCELCENVRFARTVDLTMHRRKLHGGMKGKVEVIVKRSTANVAAK